ncbi:MAG: phosphatase PAP2 family protein [Bacillota bacterium]|nr:phosphatase PAP2 family protein [Bacillota bacterium]
MKKKILGIPLYWIYIVLLVAMIMIIVGSFSDLSISNALASESNWLGCLVETWGEIFAYATIPVGGVMLFKGLWTYGKRWQKILGPVFLVLSVLIGGYLFGDSLKIKAPDDPTLAVRSYGYGLSENKWLCVAIGLVLFVLIAVGVYFLLKKDDPAALVKAGTLMLTVVLLQWLILLLLKYVGGRPRYRFLYYGDTAGVFEGSKYVYSEWWKFAFFSNPAKDCFYSWPSGHTATAAVTLCLTAASSCFRFDGKYCKLALFLSALAYTLIVALARILAGAHYLSDTGFGLLITSLLILGFCFLYQKVFSPLDKQDNETSSLTD